MVLAFCSNQWWHSAGCACEASISRICVSSAFECSPAVSILARSFGMIRFGLLTLLFLPCLLARNFTALEPAQHFWDLPKAAVHRGIRDDFAQHKRTDKDMPRLLSHFQDELNYGLPSNPDQSTLAQFGLARCSGMTGIHLLKGTVQSKKFNGSTLTRPRRVLVIQKRALHNLTSIKNLLFAAVVVFHPVSPIVRQHSNQYASPLSSCEAVEYSLVVIARRNKQRVFRHAVNTSVGSCDGQQSIRKRIVVNVTALLPHFLLSNKASATEEQLRPYNKLFLHIRPLRREFWKEPKFHVVVQTGNKRDEEDNPMLVFIRGQLICGRSEPIAPVYPRKYWSFSPSAKKPVRVCPCRRKWHLLGIEKSANTVYSNIRIEARAAVLDIGVCEGVCYPATTRRSCPNIHFTENAFLRGHVITAEGAMPAQELKCTVGSQDRQSFWVRYCVYNSHNSNQVCSDSGLVLLPRFVLPLVVKCRCG